MTMKVKECMSDNPRIVSKKASIKEVAAQFKEIDSGFLPVGDGDKLDGVITDRDIVIRVVAEGKSPEQIKAGDVLTNKVLYCFEDDDITQAAQSMKEQKVYRLVVLNNPQEKRLRGVITLGDISRIAREHQLVGETAEAIKQAA